MIGSGNRQERITSQTLVFDEWPKLALDHQVLRFCFEAHGPIIWFGQVPSPGIRVKIVDQVATTDYEYLFIAHGRQSLAQLKMKRRWLGFIDTQLDHRYVCIRINMS